MDATALALLHVEELSGDVVSRDDWVEDFVALRESPVHGMADEIQLFEKPRVPGLALLDEPAVCSTTSGFWTAQRSSKDLWIREAASRGFPVRSASVLPVFAGSMSIPPTRSIHGFSAASLADSMPMGPRPNWATLMRFKRN